MSRVITVGAAQLGAIQLVTPREVVLTRMLALLDAAAASGVRMLLFPELALTTFFPRHNLAGEDTVDAFFEAESDAEPDALRRSNPHTKPLFDRAHSLGIDIALGYAEKWTAADGNVMHYNTLCYYSAQTDAVIAKYRKVHLPGTAVPTGGAQEQLEKMYFAPGDLGFPAFRAPGLVDNALKADKVQIENAEKIEGLGDPILGMLICNDRRWPEAWRSYGLQGAELVLEGYNTCAYYANRPTSVTEQEALAVFHHRLSCQAGSYHNACFSIHAAKAGNEDGGLLIASSLIVAPGGQILAESKTSDDELITATIDLAECRAQKEGVFAFAKHRRTEHYGRLIEQTGVVEPPLLSWPFGA
ncbi:n-carbamyl-d-amino acid amidohydrolase [Grosmannia clavigera kw1407]|uniref:N-carbamyl-d-amino acid amidohydrolase n=1 Tax=Grosmannia clavigera (strain kw1407 / UAMH 11150) TaxID=655863 RepID=F0XAW1_GROCL|nr:n-carbamyl-d-amino acid amidohydrolase [Grosmannia clavigera kw1407]EFX05134.1 n-carbamyl-d-amino acid amidohydrolase [Grosmannia clavigera kw1407]